jgi:hypothetical protein
MAKTKLEERVAALEAEVAKLKAMVQNGKASADPWTEHVWGAFANDPVYEEAMRLGREYRESLRPKARKPRKVTKSKKT